MRDSMKQLLSINGSALGYILVEDGGKFGLREVIDGLATT